MGYKFEIYKDASKQHRVRFWYNGDKIFTTEAYSSKANAQNAIDAVKKNGATAPTEDNS